MKVNVTELIDERPLGWRQVTVIVLCGLVALLDGFDTQSIGIAAPQIAAALGMARPALAPVFAAALLGAMAGALTMGPLSDRVGRRRVLIFATVFFAVFTAATAQATSYETLIAYRFLAGVGLGGATPCFIALTAEYAPARLRGAVISAMWAGFPLGGVVGGLVNPGLIAAFGWRSVFYIGGALPLVLAVMLALALPESLRFLAAKGAPLDQLRRTLARIAPAEAASATEVFVTEERTGNSGVRNLFIRGRAARTLLLWVVFFSSFLILVFTPLWAPTLLQGPGRLTAANAALVVAMSNLGSVIGTAGFGRLLDRFGVGGVLLGAFVVGTGFVAAIGLGGAHLTVPAASAFMAGFLVGGGSAGAITLSATIYPTEVRSTGVGWGMAMGRLGQVAGPFVAGAMLSAGWEADRIFPGIAVFSLLAALSVALLMRLKRQG
jgi:AAHS family 4-hydroxybenzoate transporter-like MFS transporter